MTVDLAEIRRLASELRAAPHLMLREDLDLAAELLDLLAEDLDHPGAGVPVMTRLPPGAVSGLRGDYEGTCVACMKPTDSGLGFHGEAEFHIAALMHLGVPREQATLMIADEDGRVRDGVYDQGYRVCGSCARSAGFPEPAVIVVGGELPTIGRDPDEAAP